MEIPESLKTPSIREPAKRLHVLVMTDGGDTRRFSLSTTFLWIMASLALMVILALGVLSYLTSSLLVDNRSLKLGYDYELRRLETQAYNRSIPDSPEAAGRLLDRLDRAAMSAVDDDQDLPQAVPDVPGGPPEPQGVPSPPVRPDAPAAPDPAQAQGPAQAAGEAAPAAAAQAAAPAPGASGAGEPASPPAAGEDPAAASAQQAPAGPEEEAWTAFHNRLAVPAGPAILDVDEFRFSPDGSYSYYLKQAAGPGERLRGRAITVFAVADRDGKVRLASDPEMDLRNPSRGWDIGGRYNIIASKVYKGRARIPPGGSALSCEVLAWDEDSKDLIFMKRVPLGGGG
ncbi:MAG: hypothetical protein LBQ12_03490 [Deltaproteobacteria bacterium]|nr:hypothetical protein [Deltaproteobacteria bacterium]